MFADAGDVEDVKRAMKRLLAGPKFWAKMTELVVGKGDGFMPPMPLAVYEEERLSHNVLPMAELIGYRTSYDQTSEIVKAATHDVGVRWTAVAKDERTVTRYIERLAFCTVHLLWNSTLDTQVASGPITIGEVDFSPLVPTAEHPFLKAAVVVAHVPTWSA